MTSWTTYLNELPESVLRAIREISRDVDKTDEWELLRAGNTRRVYRYQPDDDQRAWVVKWDRSGNLRKYFRRLRDNNEALEEHIATQTAITAGVPAAPCRYAAASQSFRWPVETILVFDLLQARPLKSVLEAARHDSDAVRRLLEDVALLCAKIHRAGLLHGDFSSTNILVDTDNRLHIIDCKGLRRVNSNSANSYRKDPSCLLEDLIEIGLPHDDLAFFLAEYLEALQFEPVKGHWIDSMIDKAWERCEANIRRAYRNCIRRSRAVVRFSFRSLRVFMFSNSDRNAVEEALSHEMQSSAKMTNDAMLQVRKGQQNGKKDSHLLNCWRMANALHRGGLGGHATVAFAKGAWPSRKEYLVCNSMEGAQRLSDALRQPKQRRKALIVAGEFMRRLHTTKMRLSQINPEIWRMVPKPDGSLQLISTDAGVYQFIEEETDDDPFNSLLQWLATETDLKIGLFDLCHFLNGYCHGPIDRELWMKITKKEQVKIKR